MRLPLIQLLAEVDAEPGQGTVIAASLAIAVLFAAGVAKCIAIMARPQTHSLCVGALAVLLSVYTLSAVCGFLATLYPLPQGGITAFQLVCLFGLAIAWIMALVGLIHYRSRKESYNQGRVQAWFALGISSLPAIIYAVVLATGFTPSDREIAERELRR